MPKCDIETALRHECSSVNLLHIFRTPFPNNTSGRLLPGLNIYHLVRKSNNIGASKGNGVNDAFILLKGFLWHKKLFSL